MDVNLFTPYPLQKQFINAFADNEALYGAISAPRGSGKTLLGINLLLYWVLGNPKCKAGWCSPTHSQSRSVFEQITTTAHQLIVASNKTEGTIQFLNGSTIKFLSGDSTDSIRGFRFNYLVLDEVAFLKEIVISSILLPTLNPTGKKCLMISTPKGKNHFYNWFTKDDVISMSFPLTECPYINQELVEEARRSLPEDVFKQEYMAEFTDGGSEVFRGIDAISVVNNYVNESRERCFVGVDTGLSDDYSVLCIMNEAGRVLHIDRRNGDNISTIANEFLHRMSRFNIVGGFVECNGIGQAMFDLLNPKQRRLQKFITTQDSKTQIVRSLIEDIELQNIELPTKELDKQLNKELGIYTYKLSQNGKISFSHPNGEKDDMVDALLLANKARNEIRTNRIYIGKN
jgi:hypothetical protein